MTKKDLKTMVVILMAGAAIFGGMLAWAEKANHVTDTDIVIGRNIETLQVGGGK